MVDINRLQALGEQLMTAAGQARTPRQRAIQLRDGLLIALLAARPLRRRNLVGLQLDRHLVRRGAAWWLQIPAAETKTRVPLEMSWPASLEPWLEVYLVDGRPVLCRQQGRWNRPGGAALWISGDGSAMTSDAVYDRIMRRTREAFGQGINPHLFRDCAATTLAMADPENIGTAASVLGHRSLLSTERFYNQAQSVDAACHLHRVLAGLREGTLRLDEREGETS